MPKAGDRVIIEGTKIGAGRREGTFLQQIGSLIKVRWNDGSESLLTPGAGTVTYETGKGSSKAGNSAPAAARTVAAKKAAPKTTGSAKKGAAKARTQKTTPKKK